jgi:glycosyltransferase involved in cell wall biosynthesis
MNGYRRLAIFGPLPPPHGGMETITHTVLSELGRLGSTTGLRYRHVNTAVNSSQRGQELFRPRKLVLLLRQLALGSSLALRGYDAYYPISQNRIGLLRDVVLLLPFRLARRTVILHLHGAALNQVLRDEPSWMRGAVRAVAGGPRTYGIVLTPSLRPCLEPLVRPQRISVLRNAALVPPLTPDPGDRRASLSVLYLGMLRRSKGYRELVRAVSRLARVGVPVQLDLAGEPGSDEDDEWIAAYGNDPAIRFRGPLIGNAKWNALGSAQVLALPSIAREGQPLAILEGMAAGCAILTTAQGGIGETVGDKEGVVLDPLRGQALEAEIERALRRWSEDRDEVIRLGRAARERYERDFSPERFIEGWLSACTT